MPIFHYFQGLIQAYHFFVGESKRKKSRIKAELNNWKRESFVDSNLLTPVRLIYIALRSSYLPVHTLTRLLTGFTYTVQVVQVTGQSKSQVH